MAAIKEYRNPDVKAGILEKRILLRRRFELDQ
jgi:hypothetical protein